MRRLSRWCRLAAAGVLPLVLGCGRSPNGESPHESELVVFAAASLGDGFTRVGEAFRRHHPGVSVRFNLAGTQQLRTQLEHGAEADVFAAADQIHMQALVRGGYVNQPSVFAHNEPVLVVANDRAGVVKGLGDLPALQRIVIGVPEVPIGRYTLEILDRATKMYGNDFRERVETKVVSRELNVRQVLGRVAMGEADAGVVYRSDTAKAKNEVKVVTIPSEVNVIASYPIAVVVNAAHPSTARAWVSFVLSEDGRDIMKTAGFLPPTASSP
jgi:molybdate transport system substrate-binding protein